MSFDLIERRNAIVGRVDHLKAREFIQDLLDDLSIKVRVIDE